MRSIFFKRFCHNYFFEYFKIHTVLLYCQINIQIKVAPGSTKVFQDDTLIPINNQNQSSLEIEFSDTSTFPNTFTFAKDSESSELSNQCSLPVANNYKNKNLRNYSETVRYDSEDVSKDSKHYKKPDNISKKKINSKVSIKKNMKISAEILERLQYFKYFNTSADFSSNQEFLTDLIKSSNDLLAIITDLQYKPIFTELNTEDAKKMRKIYCKYFFASLLGFSFSDSLEKFSFFENIKTSDEELKKMYFSIYEIFSSENNAAHYDSNGIFNQKGKEALMSLLIHYFLEIASKDTA